MLLRSALVLPLILIIYPSVLFAQDTIDIERNAKIDLTLYNYYNGTTSEAKELAKSLRTSYPEEPFFYELLAEIIWQELDKAVAPGQPKNKSIDRAMVNRHRHLVEQFYEEINGGLWRTDVEIKKNPNNSKAIFLRGMLLVRQGGFMAKYDSLRESDKKTAEGLTLLKKSMQLDGQLCSANAMFALAKHILIESADKSFLHSLVIRFQSLTYKALGNKFDNPQVFRWLKESLACNSGYYWTKDVEIDKKLIYQDILMKQAGRMDADALPVLEELNKLFPNNKTVRGNLFLVKRHLNK